MCIRDSIYTFWYHPMVNPSAHLIGFLYMFLLLLQGSLFFTRIHINRWWTLLMEFTVLIHGTLVAVMQGNGIWPVSYTHLDVYKRQALPGPIPVNPHHRRGEN